MRSLLDLIERYYSLVLIVMILFFTIKNFLNNNYYKEALNDDLNFSEGLEKMDITMNDRFTGKEIRIQNDDEVGISEDNNLEDGQQNPDSYSPFKNEVALTSVIFLFLIKHKIFGFIVLILFLLILFMNFI